MIPGRSKGLIRSFFSYLFLLINLAISHYLLCSVFCSPAFLVLSSQEAYVPALLKSRYTVFYSL